MALTNKNRILTLTTPLADNSLIAIQFEGWESLVAPYEYKITCLSNQLDLTAESLLLQPACLQLSDDQAKSTYFHGKIYQFTCGAVQPFGLREYQLTLVPWLRLLELKYDSRIFTNKTIPDIVRQVIQESGFSDINYAGLNKSYESLIYCTQFNESNLTFILRLLQQAKIYFYFQHEKNKHVLYLVDNINALPHFSKPVNFYRQLQQDGEYLNACKPIIRRFCVESNTEKNELEIEGNYINLRAGQHIQLFDHDDDTQNGYYVISKMQHHASDNTHVLNQTDTMAQCYQQIFFCFNTKNTIFQPIQTIAKPAAPGLHQATVIGDNEIHCDDDGRIKVKFPWTSRGENSCWLRVGQYWAGNQIGQQFIPRAGQAVLIVYQDNDLDCPYVLGAITNEQYLPMHELPQQLHKSWLKTHSINHADKTAGNYIEFNDELSQAEMKLYAQKKYICEVTKNYSLTIDADENISINGDALVQLLGEGEFNAEKIILNGGGSEIVFDADGMHILGSRVNILTAGGGALMPIARVGDQQQCPQYQGNEPHQGGAIYSGSTLASANGLMIARMGDLAQCQHQSPSSINEGISSFIIEGQAVACVGHSLSHGGKITSGSSTVFVGGS